jgi:hypothetical protein
MKQNITLAVEKPLLKRARAIAAQRGKSVSALLADELEKIADQDAAYDKAMANALAFLKSPFHLGGEGLGDRERLHARKSIR